MATGGDETAPERRWRRAGRALGASLALWPLAAQAPVAAPANPGPLVDEPITGMGNDDLWQAPCDPPDDEADCPAWEGETDG